MPSEELNLCWQPADDTMSVQERGETESSAYTAVVYDNPAMKKGDMVHIEGLGFFIITSIKKYISHRLVSVRSTDRRAADV